MSSEDSDAWEAAFSGVTADPTERRKLRRMMRWVWKNAGHSGMDFEEFAARATRGKALARLAATFLARQSPDPKAETGLPVGLDVEAAARGFVSRIDGSALESSVAREIANGSVILATTHAGSLHALRRVFRDLPYPTIGIGQGHGRGGSTLGERGHLSTKGNVEMQYVKLTKLMRKSPHVVLIAIDGAVGGETVETDIFGTPVTFGLGAGFLSKMTKAPILFTYSRWSGSDLKIEVDPPFTIERSDDPDAWRGAYAAFLQEKIQNTLAGPPEDMRLVSGIWGKLKGVIPAK